MLISEAIFSGSFSPRQIRQQVIDARLTEIRQCEAILTGASQTETYKIYLGQTYWVNLDIVTAKRFLKRRRQKLEMDRQQLRERCSKDDASHDLVFSSKNDVENLASVIEIEEELDENDHILSASLNGKMVKPKLSNRQESLKPKASSNLTNSISEFNSEDQHFETFDANTFPRDCELYELEILAGEMNSEMTDEKHESEEEVLEYINSDEDADEDYADEVLFGTSLSLIPANSAIEKRLKEELQKVNQDQILHERKSFSENTSENNKGVRFSRTLEIRSFDSNVTANNRKQSKFQMDHQDKHDALQLKDKHTKESVMSEKVIERADTHDPNADRSDPVVRDNDVLKTHSNNFSESLRIHEDEKVMTGLISEYHADIYKGEDNRSGFFIDKVEDLYAQEYEDGAKTPTIPTSGVTEPSDDVLQDNVIERIKEPQSFDQSITGEIEKGYESMKQKFAISNRKINDVVEESGEYAESRFKRSMRNLRKK
ncbi:hypothetical protein FDK38_004559 [Candidozyma auris]|nr:hypothetical protein FDK38_004559 [[Candida] auris]